MPSLDSTIDGLFQEQARRTPQAVALTSAEEKVTYGELDRRSNRLARRLAALGVRAEVRVGLCLDRSIERIVAILAILKAGGCYVPLDPGYPEARLAYLLLDTAAQVLVTEERWRASLPDTSAIVLSLDRDGEALARESAEPLADPAGGAGADGLAYVMYTSGSTGLPKGVAVRHRSVVGLVRDCGFAHLGTDEVLLQLAPFSFDASTFEIWGALLTGGRLVVPPPGAVSLAELGELLARHEVTTLWLSAGLFHQMVDTGLESLRQVRQLLAGGDVLSVPRCRRVLAELPGTRLINGYGPTETTTFACCYPLTDPARLEPSVPLGFPLATATVELLDADFQPVARGEEGEIFVGGLGLARGYLNQPELTAERFLPHPSGGPGERLYRTGDLARRRATGEIEFLGRIDGQVKVRGFRIEPEEVEAALLAHPQIRDAAVIVRRDPLGEKQLAACVVPEGGEGEAGGDLRAGLRPFLRSRLPEHMVPSLFRFLPEIPLTFNGKVDRRALARPELWQDEVAAEPQEPAPAARSPLEALLAAIWAEVLGLRRVASDESFLDLGGHSLQALRALSRVRTALGVEVPVFALLEAATLADFAAQVEQALAEGRPALPPIAPAAAPPADGEGLPLSFAQARLWFLNRLEPGSPVYNLALAFRLTGTLDAGLLERCLDEVFRRQEALRTTFVEGPDGEPRQRVAAYRPAGLPQVDLAGLPSAAAWAEASRQAAREARRPFDLVHGPVARALLLRLGEREHQLVFLCHHIAFDGWSVGVLRRELGALYGALGAGRPSPLPAPAFQYGDFAVWQRRWLAGEALEAQLAYWRQRLAGAPAALDLPADRPRPPVQSFRGANLPFAFTTELAAGLRGLARSEGSTLFMAALAAFSALLGRLSGQADLVVGSPVANRSPAGTEDLLGFFVNTLALRADLAGDPPFRVLLGRVRESALAAFSHQDLPFERLVEELQPERDLSRSPLFQVMLSLDPLRGSDLAELSCELLPVDTGAAMFDLSFFLADEESGLTGLLEYATDLFDATTVARLGRSFLVLLSGLKAEGSGLRLSELPLLAAAERWQILGEWHEPGPAATPARCLHDLVAAQAARTPQAVALVASHPGGERLTYCELELRAGRLARRLAALGVGPEVRVGVCLSRSPALVVALLGILEAGGAYVPLDPNYPQERLGFMLQDAAAAVLVTETALASRLPASRARLLVLDEKEDRPAEAEPIPALAGNLAYLIYTSGSTGKPKAVAIEHRSAVAFVHWAQGVFDPAELAAVLASTSISFDLSVFELFVTLASGGRVILAENVLELPELPAAGEVTLVNTVPSALSAMAELVRALPAGVRTVNLAGEPLKGALAQGLYASGIERVRNLYGPSEDTTYSTFEVVERESRREPTIGRPIAGSWARLLDPELRLVPAGVPGEIYLGGAGLARGYLGRPELTAERFVPDPLGAVASLAGARLYRTGDLGRWLPDGRIEYLGRLDHQVKVRGFRIELGEIETALEAHPRVREAVVVALGEPGGDRSLAAYFVAAGGLEPTAGELRDHLRGRLAEFMVPSLFTRLESLPLTPNGKVDRKALLAPDGGSAVPARPAAPRGPADPLEELLAGIWAKVLEREEVPGVDDNFFELGGHSLLATRVVSRVRAALGIELPLRAIFAAPTVASLAVAVAAQRQLTASQALSAPIQPVADRSDLPLSFAQQRLWLLDRLEPGSPVYNLPLPFLIRGPLDAVLLERALAEVLRRHEVLRTTFEVVAGSGEPRLVVAAPGAFTLPHVDLSGLPPGARTSEAERLNEEESWRPFDLASGPVLRATLLVAGDAEQSLLLTVHHIAGDGWSIEVLLGELAVLYQAFAAGLPSPLPELAIQYADYAVWQRRLLAGPVLATQLAYWRRQLAAAPEALDLPADRPRPAVETSRGAQFLTPLPPALAAAARALARRRGATVFMVLLSAFAALLQRLTGETDLLLGSPIAGRGRAEIEGLIGFFVNTLVLRADLSGAPSFDSLMARVREMALAAYGHQDLPFERLVEEVQPQRSLARSPLFQVSFVLGVEETVRELAPGLSLTHLPVENRTAKFDLTLALDLSGDALSATFEYRTDLFDRATVVRWASHFVHLLTSVIASPDDSLSRAGLLAAVERHQLSLEWNDRARPAAGCFVHELVAARAQAAPEAPAVVAGERRLSYGELDRRAIRLARTLLALGCGPEVRVGICLERCPELAIAALAVLKAGGAFVPLDPSYPAERLAYQLEDSQVPVLLTRRGPVADRAARRGIHCLFPHESEGFPATETGWLPAPALSADNLAYVIYTSGSTGQPKAVEIPHAGLMNLVRWHQGFYGLVPEDRATLVASPAFDASVWEFWPYLAAGASLHIPDDEVRLSPSRMVRWWAEQGISLAFLMTPLAEQVLEETVPPGLDLRLRALITGGDRLHRRPAAGAPFRLMNHYGPSEYSVVTTVAMVPPAGSALEALPTLGRPIDGTRVYVLDGHGEPVPVGVAGELHVTGSGLARGYLRRPDLTAERFVPDPFAIAPGGRLYRTGDLARYRGDGEIEFLGRVDQQVKVRGFRIELGEVEAVLASHPAVEQAVVATHTYGPGDLRLVAWAVLKAGELAEKIEAEALLAWVRERLPEFMVPSAAVVLAALPLMPSGKVDRRALPLPVAAAGAAARTPHSPIEELVAGLWTEILGGGRVGLHDDFFALGGHSLLAIRLLARLRAATGVELPLRAVFAYPTVAVLAAEVERALRATDSPPLPPIGPAAAGEDALASSAQERLWFFHQLDPGGSVLNVPHCLRLTGLLEPAALAACLAEIARRHASLRTSFLYGDGGLRQRIAPPRELVLPLADLGALPPPRREEEGRRAAAGEAQEPFDLAAAPLWRARLLRLGAAEHLLLLTFHHAVVDGWSIDLFDRELAALFPAHAEQVAGIASVAGLADAASVSEPPLQYADYAVWQRRWLNRETLAPQLAYWRRQLAGMPPALDLPADHPRPARQSFRGAVRSLPPSPELSAGVKALGRREGSTLFMTALAAFAALLGRYTGQEDVVVGSPSANRHRPGTEGIIGCFVDNMVLRLDLAGDPSFRQLLRQAREVALGAYAHPDVPFERLVEELDPPRDKSRNPLVQVLLLVQTAAGEPLRFAGLAAEPVEAHSATAQFDLTLSVHDGLQGLTLAAEYSTALFTSATVDTMLAHLALLLAAVVAAPALRLSELPDEIVPRPRLAAAPEGPGETEGTAENDRARRQALLAERRSRLAGADKDLLESRLRRKG